MTDFRQLTNICKTIYRKVLMSYPGWWPTQRVGPELGAGGMRRAVGEMLAQRGFRVEIVPTGGAPVVYAEKAGRGPGTLLFYNHYDVQPAEPLELWDNPPFVPVVKDGVL
jgi:acetylornithine deacetylase/succinyl-diaminopimelate desuccinylase-like protein